MFPIKQFESSSLFLLRPAMNDLDKKEYFERSGVHPSPLFGQDMAIASRNQRNELAEVIKRAVIPVIA